MKLEDIINTVICGDSLEVMKSLPDKCIDLVLTDPPYGIGGDQSTGNILGKWGFNKYDKTDWDKAIPSKEYFDEIFRISKNQVICGGNYFVEYLKPSMGWVVWDKKQDNFSFSDCELVYTSFDQKTRMFRYSRSATVVQEGVRFHPTQKPVEFMRWLLEKFSDPDQIVLDPFLGSGTTAVAAKQLGRKYIGIEISERYCSIARERLRQDILL